ncbi:class I SAM-dependent methyltransferase [Rhodanobacter hydrolyticus]|uniref:Class I SAM-dependent methyltransferase n=1 Tax=Rhodanobacter hydrolyticus TaxID=2250595 RepID=A0ABW8J908_9GAMM
MLDGIPCYAPELARESPGFKAEHFAKLAAVEDGHFWFRARNELIVHVLRRYFPHARSMLEIGCGTGYVLREVTDKLPQLRVCGSEIFLEGLSFASRRVPVADLFQMDAQRVPFVEEFDLIGAFDVVEHIADDMRVLREIHHALMPGGGAIFTVPQHPWLWSAQDEHACHQRRYRRSELANKLRTIGFRVVFSTSFVSLLLPLLAASRWRRQTLDADGEASTSEFGLSPLLNSSLYGALCLERWLIQIGLRFPAGGTRLIAAVKTAPQ